MGGLYRRESGRSFAAVVSQSRPAPPTGCLVGSCARPLGSLGRSLRLRLRPGWRKAVGIVFLLRLVPAGLLAPFVGVLGDRYRRERVLFVSALLRCGLCAGAAVAVAMDGPSVLVYALAILTSIANAPYKSAQQAIMPTLAATPNELTATNAVASTVESLAFFLGPALAGVLLALSGTDVVFAVAAAMFGAASSCCCGCTYRGPRRRKRCRRRRSSASASRVSASSSSTASCAC